VVDNILTYTYSAAGDRTKLEELDGSVSQWTYDRARQLTSEQRTGAVAFHVTYSYDPVGNRTLETDAAALTTFVFDAANQLSSAERTSGITTYAHDADGNRTQLAAPAWQVDYTWDEQNRLTRADTPSQTVSMQYDALSRRTAKENAAGTHEFTFDGKKILEERDGAGNVDHEYTSTLDEYGDLLSDYDGAANTAYQFDALGSTAALLDESASVTDRYVYRAFGEIASHTGASDTPFTFVGRQSYQHDSELDLYFATSRHLDPVVGRWTSQDPIRWQAGDENLYRYVKNNPASVVDPSGEQELTPEQQAYVAEERRFILGGDPLAAQQFLNQQGQQELFLADFPSSPTDRDPRATALRELDLLLDEIREGLRRRDERDDFERQKQAEIERAQREQIERATKAREAEAAERQQKFHWGRSRSELLQEQEARVPLNAESYAGVLAEGLAELGETLNKIFIVATTAWDEDVVEQRGHRLARKADVHGETDPGFWFLTYEFLRDYVVPVDPVAESVVGYDIGEDRAIEGDELIQRRAASVAIFSTWTAMLTRATAQAFPSLGRAMYPPRPLRAPSGSSRQFTGLAPRSAAGTAGVAVAHESLGSFSIFVDEALANTGALPVLQTLAGAGMDVAGIARLSTAVVGSSAFRQVLVGTFQPLLRRVARMVAGSEVDELAESGKQWTQPLAKKGHGASEGVAPRGTVPHGFITVDEFGNFGAAITRKMRGAGYDDVQAVLQGSGVTGARAMSKPGIPAGTPFDVLKASDFDVALVSPKLLAKAKELGIPLRGGGYRTGPLWPGNLRAMGVGDLSDDLLKTLYQHEGRRINFMIFESMEEALKRGPSIRIPGT